MRLGGGAPGRNVEYCVYFSTGHFVINCREVKSHYFDTGSCRTVEHVTVVRNESDGIGHMELASFVL